MYRSLTLLYALQASLVIQRTHPSPLRTQSFPAKQSSWGSPSTPGHTPRGRNDEVLLVPPGCQIVLDQQLARS